MSLKKYKLKIKHSQNYIYIYRRIFTTEHPILMIIKINMQVVLGGYFKGHYMFALDT